MRPDESIVFSLMKFDNFIWSVFSPIVYRTVVRLSTITITLHYIWPLGVVLVLSFAFIGPQASIVPCCAFFDPRYGQLRITRCFNLCFFNKMF